MIVLTVNNVHVQSVDFRKGLMLSMKEVSECFLVVVYLVITSGKEQVNLFILRESVRWSAAVKLRNISFFSAFVLLLLLRPTSMAVHSRFANKQA